MSAATDICAKIAARLGLTPHPRFVPSLERAEPRFIERYGVGLAGLVDRMDGDRELFHDLAGALSVGETYFLRHDAHFERIVSIVSTRIASLGAGEQVVIWSAGCSSGEEPYSVALALTERLGDAVLDRVSLIATDVDPRAIARAVRAEYTPWSFRGAPGWLDERYFRRSTGELRVLSHPRIRRAVSFECATLDARVRAFGTGSVDIILFRNVSIYLTDEARLALHVEMRRVLRTSGLLVQGPSDPAPLTTEFVREPSDPTFCCHLPVSEAVTRDLEARRLDRPRLPNLPEPAPRLPPPRPAIRAARISRPAPTSHLLSVPVAVRAALAAAAPKVADLESVLALAERGELELALATAKGFSLDPVRSAVLVGKLHLAANAPGPAIENLRRAVFLAADDVMARYWYAHALHLGREAAAAQKQLVDLERRLSRVGADVLFDDGEFRAEDLRASVDFLLGSYR